ncbi:MAG: polyprenyl synthetase family protein [Dehalococcoidales bacterium]|nr:polyprenyl synthetase family protein [Dehalococcoidales bacterium]
MSLDKIYAPIRKDLGKIEDGLCSIYQDSPPRISDLLAHSLGASGKRVRPALVLLSGKSFNYNLSCLLPMALAVEVLHTATLVHDDAIDNSPARRGRATINKLWGEDKAILLGDYLLAKAEELAATTEDLPVIRLFARTIKNIASGELHQSFDAFRLEQTRQQYLERISGKTASLLCLATESGAILSQAPPETVTALREYGYNLGIAFQIVDDILDFVGDEKEMGKPVGSDLAEGTLTLPAMLILEHHPDDNPVRRLFQNEGDRQENIRRAIGLFRDSPLVEECYRIASDYQSKCCLNLKTLPDNASRRSLQALSEYVLTRKK